MGLNFKLVVVLFLIIGTTTICCKVKIAKGIDDNNQSYISYHQQSSKAYCLLEEERYYEASRLYQKLLHDYKELFVNKGHNDYYYYSIVALNLEDSLLSKKMITESISRGLPLEKYNIYKELSGVEIKYDSLYNIFLSKLDSELITVIDSLVSLDQIIRSDLQSKSVATNQFQLDSVGLAAMRKQSRIDEKNYHRLREVIEPYGWPTYLVLGSSEINLLLHHIPKSKRYEFGEYLYNQLLSGKIHPNIYASYMDKSQFLKNGNQIYGSMKEIASSMGEFGYVTFENTIEETNKERAKIGLSSIECEAKSKGILLPIQF